MHYTKNHGNKEIPLAILSSILAQSCRNPSLHNSGNGLRMIVLKYYTFALRMHVENQDPALYFSILSLILQRFKRWFFWCLPHSDPPFDLCVTHVMHNPV